MKTKWRVKKIDGKIHRDMGQFMPIKEARPIALAAVMGSGWNGGILVAGNH